MDAASDAQRDAARKIIRSLNPEAEIVETRFADVPLSRLLNTGRFSLEKAQRHPVWFKELYGFSENVPETEEYGVKHFVYRARRPFHPQKFHRFIHSPWPGVIRAKGHFWLATRPQWVGELSQAGAIVRNQALGFWWAAVPKERWPASPAWREDIVKHWDPVYGDRRQELVFIGTDMDIDALCARLDACLVEAGGDVKATAAWCNLSDPFPVWRRGEA